MRRLLGSLGLCLPSFGGRGKGRRGRRNIGREVRMMEREKEGEIARLWK